MMVQILKSLWRDEQGVLSFEWTLLAVLLVIGVVSGVAAGRDAITDELGDVAGAMLAWNQSYSFSGIPALGIPASSYNDPGHTFTTCTRATTGPTQFRDDAVGGG
jgi:Flp pilus assembly pilin Flp